MRSTWISTRTPGSGRAVLSRQAQSTAVTHEQTVAFQQTVAVSQELRDKIANFDDFCPAAAQLLLLGATLFRHPDLLGTAVPVRRARRHQPVDRPAGQRLGSIAKLDELQTRPTQTSAEAAAIVLDPL